MDQQKRIEELEVQVKRLTEQVQALRSGRVTADQGSSRGGTAGSRAGLNRVLLLIMTVALGLGAAIAFSTQRLTFQQIVRLDRALAAMDVDYPLLICTMLAAAALLCYVIRRWMMFTWMAMIATYCTYALYFSRQPAVLPMPPRTYFWVTNGCLTLCYLLFSAACILDMRRSGTSRRRTVLAALVNSALYLAFVWMPIRQHFPEQEGWFRLGLAGVLACLAGCAATSAPNRNYLFQLFVAKTVALFTLSMHALLPHELLLLAMAMLCFGLAFVYGRTGVVVFKTLDLVLLAVIFVWTVSSLKVIGTVTIGRLTVPANWFSGVAVPTVFVLTAWLYEHFTHTAKPARHAGGGGPLLAHGPLDVHSAAAAMFHAAAAAIILLTLTIIDQSESPMLPYVLTAESVVMAAIGFLLRTPQIEVGSVLLLMAAHISYHFFLIVDKQGFAHQENFLPFTILVVMVTYFGAYCWEAYLRRAKEGKPWEHHTVAAIPYLLAAFMLTTLIDHTMDGIAVPLAQNALGIGLLFVGAALGYASVKISGVMALGIGAVTFAAGLYAPGRPLQDQPYAMVYLGLLLLTYVAAERLILILRRRDRAPLRVENLARTVLVLTAGLLGLLALAEWAPDRLLTRYWLGNAVVGLVLATLFRENRYRWAALFILAAAGGRIVLFERPHVPQMRLWLLLGEVAIVALLLILSWVPWRRTNRPSPETQTVPSEGSSTNE